MNMDDVEPPRPESAPASFLTKSDPTPRDELFAVLEEKAGALEDRLYEERFLGRSFA